MSVPEKTPEEIVASLPAKTRDRFVNASDYSPKRQATPSIGLNIALKGGFAYGRQVLVWGNKSAGKSSMLLQMIAMAQKDGILCAWIDAENSFDSKWARRMGVDTDKLLLSTTKTVNDMVEDVKELYNRGVKLIVVDSISVLLGSAFFEDKGELKELNDTKQIGNNAKDMTHAVNMINSFNNDMLLVLISQQRNSFGSMHATHIPTGGMATIFNSSQVVKLWSSTSEAVAIKGQVKNGDLIFEEKIGRPVNWTVDYSKLGPMGQIGTYDFYYQGDSVGVDTVAETLDYAVKYGLVKKGGAWYTVDGNQLQGRNAAVKYLRENPEAHQKIWSELLAIV